MIRLFILFNFVLFHSVLYADVSQSDIRGFKISIEHNIAVKPQKVFAALAQDISIWWHPDHTYSGDSSNLYLETHEKGWFGEKLPQGGFVKHLEVIYFEPGRSIRLSGGLGPLQSIGAQGTLIFTTKASPNSEHKTILEVTYQVSGFLPEGMNTWAQPVDTVLSQQINRLKTWVESGELANVSK